MFLIVHTPVLDFYFGCRFPVGMRRQSATIRQRRFAEYWKKKCKILNVREIFALLLCEDYLWCDMKNKTLKTDEMFNTQLIFVLFAGN
jgi:hypothetical protein